MTDLKNIKASYPPVKSELWRNCQESVTTWQTQIELFFLYLFLHLRICLLASLSLSILASLLLSILTLTSLLLTLIFSFPPLAMLYCTWLCYGVPSHISLLTLTSVLTSLSHILAKLYYARLYHALPSPHLSSSSLPLSFPISCYTILDMDMLC